MDCSSYFPGSSWKPELVPAPITHAEFYYGFIGVTTVWQILFLVIARDPIRYRPIMIVGVLEKLSFVIAVTVLLVQQRAHTMILPFLIMDFALAGLLLLAYLRTPIESPVQKPAHS